MRTNLRQFEAGQMLWVCSYRSSPNQRNGYYGQENWEKCKFVENVRRMQGHTKYNTRVTPDPRGTWCKFVYGESDHACYTCEGTGVTKPTLKESVAFILEKECPTCHGTRTVHNPGWFSHYANTQTWILTDEEYETLIVAPKRAASERETAARLERARKIKGMLPEMLAAIDEATDTRLGLEGFNDRRIEAITTFIVKSNMDMLKLSATRYLEALNNRQREAAATTA